MFLLLVPSLEAPAPRKTERPIHATLQRLFDARPQARHRFHPDRAARERRRRAGARRSVIASKALAIGTTGQSGCCSSAARWSARRRSTIENTGASTTRGPFFAATCPAITSSARRASADGNHRYDDEIGGAHDLVGGVGEPRRAIDDDPVVGFRQPSPQSWRAASCCRSRGKATSRPRSEASAGSRSSRSTAVRRISFAASISRVIVRCAAAPVAPSWPST